MPHIAEVFSKHDTTSPAGTIVRLHGPDRQVIEEATDSAWNSIVEPRPERIQAAANIIRANLRLGHKTFVNINNHSELIGDPASSNLPHIPALSRLIRSPP
jgi:hypothetical protein